MTLKEARTLRDDVLAYGLGCTVPLGYGPDGYQPQIWTDSGVVRFASRAEWRTYAARMLRRRRRALREYQQDCDRQMMRKRRSPIEIMIDRACGLE